MTAQHRDLLILGGALEDLGVLPLATHPVARDFNFDQLNTRASTACWRGYRGVWELLDGQLWLVGMFDTEDHPMDTRPLFGDRPLPLRADWYTGTLVLLRGPRLLYAHQGVGGDYGQHLRLYLRNGVLVRQRRYDQTRRFRQSFIGDGDEGGLDWLRRPCDRTVPPLWWLTPAGVQALGLDLADVHSDWL